MNKKIAIYIGGFEMPDGNAAAQRVLSNAKILRELGYETLILGLTRKNSECNLLKRFEGFGYVNLKYPESLKEWIFYLSSINNYRPYLNNSINLIIAYDFPALALNKLKTWANKRSIPILGDCTEWESNKGNPLFSLIKGFDTFYRMNRVHPRLDGLITISTFLYEFYKGKMNYVIKVPPLVDLEMSKWEYQFTKTKEITFDKIIMIYAGSPGSKSKDRLDKILIFLSKIKNDGISNFQFKVLGITHDQYIKNFKTNIPTNIEENVIFRGRLTHIEVLNEIKKAHFSFFLRDNNLKNNAGFPTKLVESISCGTPVLTNSTSNINDYLFPGENGYIIDISSELATIENLKSILNLSIDRVELMKLNCRSSRIFHYRNFVSDFQNLLNNLNSKRNTSEQPR